MMRSVKFLTLLAISLAVVDAPSTWTGQSGTFCGLYVQGQTRNRHVTGTVDAECNGCFAQHTGPFGNWGVSSWYSAANNSTQYMGWATEDEICGGSLTPTQWNSCTTGFPSPNWKTYNHPEGYYTSQFSPAVAVLGTGLDWNQTTEEEGCTILDGSFYNNGVFASIYELDDLLWAGDEHVADISAIGESVQLSCDREGCAYAESPWVSLSQNGVTSAEFRYVVVGSCLNIDGKGGC